MFKVKISWNKNYIFTGNTKYFRDGAFRMKLCLYIHNNYLLCPRTPPPPFPSSSLFIMQLIKWDPWLLFNADILIINLSVPPLKQRSYLTIWKTDKAEKEEDVTVFYEKINFSSNNHLTTSWHAKWCERMCLTEIETHFSIHQKGKIN